MDCFERLRNIALPSSDDHEIVTYQQKQLNESNQPNFRTRSSLGSLSGNYSTKFQTFSENLFSLDDKKLNNVLEDIDTNNRVSIHDTKTQEVVKATEIFVTDILKAVGEIDPRFKSFCINSGSYYDDLKVGKADEFDFVARIESLSKANVLEARKSCRKRGFVYLVVKDYHILEEFKEFITSADADEDECLKKNDNILCVDSLQNHFIELVFSAIQIIEVSDNFLPFDYFDNGKLTENSWYPKRNGPCATLYVIYMCQTTSDVVNIDIDIAPSIAYPDTKYMPAVLESLSDTLLSNQFLSIVRDVSYTTEVMLVPFRFDFTEKTDERSWEYHYSNTWRVSHSALEKAIFSRFKPLNTDKKLCRILKALKEIYLQGSIETEKESGSRSLKLQEPPSTCLTSCTIEGISSFAFDNDTESDECDYSEIDDKHNGGNNIVNSKPIQTNDKCGTSITPYRFDSSIQTTDLMPDSQNNKNNIDLTDVTNTETCHNSFDQEDNKDFGELMPHVDIIYERIPKAKSKTISNSCNVTNRASGSLFPNIYKYEIDHSMESMKRCDEVNFGDIKTSCKYGGKYQHADDPIREHDDYPTLYFVGKSSNGTSESDDASDNRHNSLLHRETSIRNMAEPDSTAKFETTESGKIAINYHDSKPLLKSYFIKMLFLAMKTAYPETSYWEEDHLSMLLKMALCTIYYAFSSTEKGILNFWFQDLIENRTKDSTCVEVLYCLEQLVKTLCTKIERLENSVSNQ